MYTRPEEPQETLLHSSEVTATPQVGWGLDWAGPVQMVMG